MIVKNKIYLSIPVRQAPSGLPCWILNIATRIERTFVARFYALGGGHITLVANKRIPSISKFLKQVCTLHQVRAAEWWGGGSGVAHSCAKHVHTDVHLWKEGNGREGRGGVCASSAGPLKTSWISQQLVACRGKGSWGKTICAPTLPCLRQPPSPSSPHPPHYTTHFQPVMGERRSASTWRNGPWCKLYVYNGAANRPGFGQKMVRAGQLRYFFIFSIIKNDFLHFLSS